MEARAAGRAKVGLAISVTNARAATNAFIISLHACEPSFMISYSRLTTRASVRQGDRLGATVGRAISSVLLDKPTIEALILLFAQLAPSRKSPQQTQDGRGDGKVIAQIYKERVIKRGYGSGSWGWLTAYREGIAV